MTKTDLDDAVAKLRRFAAARNRAADREPRTVTLTDDEALAVLTVIEVVVAPLD